MEHTSYQIETEAYRNNCLKISDSLIYFNREHRRAEDQLDVDVFADFWSLAFLPANSPEIGVLVDDKEISFKGPVCFFIPAHSIVKWRTSKGLLVWHALISTKPLHVRFKNPVALPATINPEQLTSEELVENWLNAEEPFVQIGKATDGNVIAEKTKTIIDRNFQGDLHISEISKEMNVTNSYITKEFKKCFGVSPLEYRNKKRIFKAMQVLMFTQYSMGQLAHEVGFNDYSRFLKNFYEIMHATPREFKHLQTDSGLNLL